VELTNEFRVSVPVEDAWAVLTDVERIAPCLPGAQLQEIEGDEYRGIVKVKVGPITAQYKGKATFQEKDDAGHVAVLKAEGRDTRGQGNASARITATLVPDGDGTNVKVVTDLTVTGKVAQFGRGVLADVSGKLLTQFVECLENDLLSGAAVGAGSASAAATATAEQAASSGPAAAAAATPPASAGASAASGNGSAPTTGEAESSSPPHGDPVTGASGGAATAAGGAAKRTATADPAPPHGDAVTAEPSTVRKIDHQTAEPVDLLDAAGVPVAKRAIPLVAGVLVILWFLRRRSNQRKRNG
jgi:uncharacterized protein